MTNLKRDKTAEALYAAEMPSTTLTETDEYPYGLRIQLDEGTLKKLGIESLPEVGAVIHFTASSEVVSVNINKGEGGERRELALQITDMEIKRGAVSMEETAKVLYEMEDM